MIEISNLLNIPISLPGVGSSIPQVFFTDVASELGIPTNQSMPHLARAIIEKAHLVWRDEYASETTPSGGGSTVTALGLIAVRDAILIWQGKNPDVHSNNFGNPQDQWEPLENWNEIRENLPADQVLQINRPGAAKFREMVLKQYSYACAVSGIKVDTAIDVAHIVPYHGVESDVISNAIPLRADLHRLFDSGYMIIMPSKNNTFEVTFHQKVKSDYIEFDGKNLATPLDVSNFPSQKALEIKNDLYTSIWESDLN